MSDLPSGSETTAMWDRFFAGSKYEAKWRKRNSPGPLIIGDRLEEVSAWLARLRLERENEWATVTAENPFGRSQGQQKVA